MREKVSNMNEYIALAMLRASAIDLNLPAECVQGVSENVAILDTLSLKLKAHLAEVDIHR